MDVPGGHVNCLPPKTWRWRWGTSWPPCLPLLITTRYPSSSFYSFATLATATINFPNIYWCLSSALAIPTRPSFFLGITRTWTGAWGFISLKAKTSSSSYTIVDGIYFLMILSNIVYPACISYDIIIINAAHINIFICIIINFIKLYPILLINNIFIHKIPN